MFTLKKISIILLLVIFVLFSFCSEDQNNQAPIDSHLRLLTYNVWYGFTQVPERKPLWLEWMKNQKADIVFLQELNEYTPKMLDVVGKPYYQVSSPVPRMIIWSRLFSLRVRSCFKRSVRSEPT